MPLVRRRQTTLTSLTVTDVSVAKTPKSNTEACVVSQMSRPGVHFVDCSSTRLRRKSSGLKETRYRLQQLAGADLNLTMGADVIKPSTVVRDLGVLIDAELTL